MDLSRKSKLFADFHCPWASVVWGRGSQILEIIMKENRKIVKQKVQKVQGVLGLR